MRPATVPAVWPIASWRVPPVLLAAGFGRDADRTCRPAAGLAAFRDAADTIGMAAPACMQNAYSLLQRGDELDLVPQVVTYRYIPLRTVTRDELDLVPQVATATASDRHCDDLVTVTVTA